VHVGCNVYEIQAQKEELQSFQETSKVMEAHRVSSYIQLQVCGQVKDRDCEIMVAISITLQ